MAYTPDNAEETKRLSLGDIVQEKQQLRRVKEHMDQQRFPTDPRRPIDVPMEPEHGGWRVQEDQKPYKVASLLDSFHWFAPETREQSGVNEVTKTSRNEIPPEFSWFTPVEKADLPGEGPGRFAKEEMKEANPLRETSTYKVGKGVGEQIGYMGQDIQAIGKGLSALYHAPSKMIEGIPQGIHDLYKDIEHFMSTGDVNASTRIAAALAAGGIAKEGMIGAAEEAAPHLGIDALRTAMARAENPEAPMVIARQPEKETTLGTFGGRGARGFSKAEAEGKTFEGVEGKQRFEIGDQNMSWAKGVTGGQYPSVAGNKLYRLIDHPALFKEYPEARGIKFELSDMGSTTKASFDEGSNTIHLSRFAVGTKEGLDSVVHEVQHWIQAKEGFARGGSPVPEAAKELSSVISDMARALNKGIRPEEIKQEILKMSHGGPALENTVAPALALADSSFKETTFEQALLHLNSKNLSTYQMNEFTNAIAHGLYRRLAGEVEAKNAATRRILTEEQRAQNPPISTEEFDRSIQTIAMGARRIQSSVGESRIGKGPLVGTAPLNFEGVGEVGLAAPQKAPTHTPEIHEADQLYSRLSSRKDANPEAVALAQQYKLGLRRAQLAKDGLDEEMRFAQGVGREPVLESLRKMIEFEQSEAFRAKAQLDEFLKPKAVGAAVTPKDVLNFSKSKELTREKRAAGLEKARDFKPVSSFKSVGGVKLAPSHVEFLRQQAAKGYDNQRISRYFKETYGAKLQGDVYRRLMDSIRSEGNVGPELP